uniref:Uncharacterized protein n=1 Tax=viral metagenome TaxID=1070528 RepID=A0A6M3Y001_9ZZZZ
MRETILRIKDMNNFQHIETYGELRVLLKQNNIDYDGILVSINSGIGYIWRNKIKPVIENSVA